MRAPPSSPLRTVTISPPSAPAIMARSSLLACCAEAAPVRHKSKKAAEAAFAIRAKSMALLRSRSGAFVDLAILHRAGIQPLGGLVAVDELDDADGGVITVAEASLENTRVAALAVLVARAEHIEQFLDHGDVADLRDRLAAGVQVAALAERNQLLDDGAQLLSLRQRGGD